MTFSRKLKGKSRQVLRSTSDQIGSSAKTTARELKSLVGAVGIEPTTFGLKGRCSTTELRP
jgi:hypothetical protein